MSAASRAPANSIANPTSGPAPAPASASEPSYFEQQREMLVGEVAQALENVLQSMNKLNRSLEGVIAVGNEFGAVEALWSQFENVMGRTGEGPVGDEGGEEEG